MSQKLKGGAIVLIYNESIGFLTGKICVLMNHIIMKNASIFKKDGKIVKNLNSKNLFIRVTKSN